MLVVLFNVIILIYSYCSHITCWYILVQTSVIIRENILETPTTQHLQTVMGISCSSSSRGDKLVSKHLQIKSQIGVLAEKLGYLLESSPTQCSQVTPLNC